MDSLLTEYQKAVNSGNTQYANYLAQILASNAGIHINANEVTAAPAALVNGAAQANNSATATPSSTTSNFWGTLGGVADFMLNPFEWSPSAATAEIEKGQAGNSTTGAVVSGAGSFLSFISDIPRVGTVIVGGLLIAAGLFGLAGGSHREVINLVTPKRGGENE